MRIGGADGTRPRDPPAMEPLAPSRCAARRVSDVHGEMRLTASRWSPIVSGFVSGWAGPLVDLAAIVDDQAERLMGGFVELGIAATATSIDRSARSRVVSAATHE